MHISVYTIYLAEIGTEFTWIITLINYYFSFLSLLKVHIYSSQYWSLFSCWLLSSIFAIKIKWNRHSCLVYTVVYVRLVFLFPVAFNFQLLLSTFTHSYEWFICSFNWFHSNWILQVFSGHLGNFSWLKCALFNFFNLLLIF